MESLVPPTNIQGGTSALYRATLTAYYRVLFPVRSFRTAGLQCCIVPIAAPIYLFSGTFLALFR